LDFQISLQINNLTNQLSKNFSNITEINILQNKILKDKSEEINKLQKGS
jgi:hypothetical protein